MPATNIETPAGASTLEATASRRSPAARRRGHQGCFPDSKQPNFPAGPAAQAIPVFVTLDIETSWV